MALGTARIHTWFTLRWLRLICPDIRAQTMAMRGPVEPLDFEGSGTSPNLAPVRVIGSSSLAAMQTSRLQATQVESAASGVTQSGGVECASGARRRGGARGEVMCRDKSREVTTLLANARLS